MPKIGKKHFKYTKKGRKAAKAYAKSIKANIKEEVTGAVGAFLKHRTRTRTTGDPTSVGRTSNLGLARGVQTPTERQALGRAETTRRAAGRGLDPQKSTNPTARRRQRSLGIREPGVAPRVGIAASTELEGKDKLVEMTPSQARERATATDIRTVHSKKPFELVDLIPGRDPGAGKGKFTAKEKIHTRKVDAAKKRIGDRDDAQSRDDYSSQKNRELRSEIEHNERERTEVISRRRKDRSGLPPVGTRPIAASTEMNGKDKLVKIAEISYPSDSAEDRLKDTLATDLRNANWASRGPGATPEGIRKSQQAASILKAVAGRHRKTKVRSGRHASQSDTGKHIKPANIDRAPTPGATHAVAASTEMNWKDKFETLLERKKQEGDEAWEGFWRQHAKAGEARSPSGSKESKKTRRVRRKRQARAEAQKRSDEFRKGTVSQQRGK